MAPGMTKEQLIEEMNHDLSTLRASRSAFHQPIRDNVLESISQIDGQVVIKVFGDDSAALRQKARGDAAQAIADVPRRGHGRSWIAPAKCRRRSSKSIATRAARYGLNIGDIEDVIETGSRGKAATELWEGEKHFSVVVRCPKRERSPRPI